MRLSFRPLSAEAKWDLRRSFRIVNRRKKENENNEPGFILTCQCEMCWLVFVCLFIGIPASRPSSGKDFMSNWLNFLKISAWQISSIFTQFAQVLVYTNNTIHLMNCCAIYTLFFFCQYWSVCVCVCYCKALNHFPAGMWYIFFHSSQINTKEKNNHHQHESLWIINHDCFYDVN